MPTAKEIVALFDGASKLADGLDTPLTTVASWVDVNFIPRWWHDPILALAEQRKVKLRKRDFPAREDRIPRPKRAEAA